MSMLGNYIEGNRRWLMPLVAVFIIVAGPMLLRAFEDGAQASWPAWVSALACLLGGFVVAFGAAITDTASARVVRLVGCAAAVALPLAILL